MVNIASVSYLLKDFMGNVSALLLGRRKEVKKAKVIPYSLQSVGTGAHPGVQAVSPQVTLMN